MRQITQNTEVERLTINFIRVSAMLMIVLCHLFNAIGGAMFANMAQIFNVGVYVFFIISGFLFGHKMIARPLKWFLRRFIRIMIPVYIYYIIMYAVSYFMSGKTPTGANIVAGVFNLQGVWNTNTPFISVHLWFLTYIMICYVLVPLLQWFKAKDTSIKKLGGILAVLIVAQVLYVLKFKNVHTLQYIAGVFAFATAYFTAAVWDKRVKLIPYILLTAAMIVVMGLRLVLKQYADSGEQIYSLIYDGLLAQYSHFVLGWWLFFTLYAFCTVTYGALVKAKNLIDVCSDYSFEVYIVHYMFLKGTFAVIRLTQSMVLDLLLFIVLTAISTWILHMLSNPIADKIGKKLAK